MYLNKRVLDRPFVIELNDSINNFYICLGQYIFNIKCLPILLIIEEY